jgi:protein-disulfide isomerase
MLAAEASEAAGEQGKFWEYHDILYSRQKEWSEVSSPLGHFESYAKEVNLELEKFKDALENHKFAEKISSDKNDGLSLGVNSTPTFFLNGERLVGLRSFADLTGKVEQALLK